MLFSNYISNFFRYFFIIFIHSSSSKSGNQEYKQINGKMFEYNYLPFYDVNYAILSQICDLNRRDIINMLVYFEINFPDRQEDSTHMDFLNLIKKINDTIKEKNSGLFLFWNQFIDLELCVFEIHKNIANLALYTKKNFLEQCLKTTKTLSAVFYKSTDFALHLTAFVQNKEQHGIRSQPIIKSFEEWRSSRVKSCYKVVNKRFNNPMVKTNAAG
ncbi:hypothetical protein CDIK_0761 [Cucumispora dikerogammari]|nr:hypothetical protein CDIK_0761 [Cucumispora dikerogammari]